MSDMARAFYLPRCSILQSCRILQRWFANAALHLQTIALRHQTCPRLAEFCLSCMARAWGTTVKDASYMH